MFCFVPDQTDDDDDENSSELLFLLLLLLLFDKMCPRALILSLRPLNADAHIMPAWAPYVGRPVAGSGLCVVWSGSSMSSAALKERTAVTVAWKFDCSAMTWPLDEGSKSAERRTISEG